MTSPNRLYAAACKKHPGDPAKANAQFVEWLTREGHIERQPHRAAPRAEGWHAEPKRGLGRPPVGFGSP